MKLNNQDIYQIAVNINNNLDNLNIYIPAKANFFLQKNIQVIAAAGQEIEKARVDILKHYGVLNNDGSSYTIPEGKKENVYKEFEDLFAIEQELDIKTFSIEAFGDTQFTPAQMQTIMFMIEED